ncbi:MAG: methylenetetrahydromethanopterin dehydrogenase [Candidatus Bathyarchaeota archaeon]|nr:methylenetetrahydromethanopterin dehydrogenase [Candidatus Bathyarchaeota archaeon]
MKVLEISPLENKMLKVIVVEKEYSEPFWVAEPLKDFSRNSVPAIFRPSIAFCSFLERLIDEVKPDFATEELGNRSLREFMKNNLLAQIFKRKEVPFFAVDIDEYARESLASLIDEKKHLRDEAIKALEDFSMKEVEEHSIEEEYLAAFIQCLQQEIEEAEREIKFSVRERWIAMGILENARKIEKTEVTCIHISSPEHIEGVRKILESVNVIVETIKPMKKVVFAESSSSSRLGDLLKSTQIQVKPVIRKSSEEIPYILFFLDTDEKASPFDICMAYDAGFNIVVPYGNVSPSEAKKIVQDALFSRDLRGIKRTCFFIGGKDMDKAEEVLRTVQESMFPPFKTSVIIDPAGAYTTAAAMVAKVEDALAHSNLGNLRDKRCAVFGTGPVGRTAAILLSRLGCEVAVVSPNPQRKDGEEYVVNLSNMLHAKYGAEVKGVFAPTREKKIEVMERADVIFCAAGAGIQVIDRETLNAVKFSKIIVDVNAVPPFGVEGIKLDDDMREILPGIFAIGALAVGRLKYKVEQEILLEAKRSEKAIVFDYNYAFQLARRILKGETLTKKLAITISPRSREKV